MRFRSFRQGEPSQERVCDWAQEESRICAGKAQGDCGRGRKRDGSGSGLHRPCLMDEGTVRFYDDNSTENRPACKEKDKRAGNKKLQAIAFRRRSKRFAPNMRQQETDCEGQAFAGADTDGGTSYAADNGEAPYLIPDN